MTNNANIYHEDVNIMRNGLVKTIKPIFISVLN